MESRKVYVITLFLLFAFTIQVKAHPPLSLKPVNRLSSTLTSAANPMPPATGTIHIVAVMAEFEKEENRFTSGDGTFNLDFLQRDDIIIDPLPHDYGYFEAHLDFAKNYFETVSDGLLSIEYILLPEIIQLDQPMSHYAPTGQDGSENYKLAHLVNDTWSNITDAHLPDLSGLDPDRTMFIIFHAGSGRNIELMGTTLYKTPQDIPSVFMNKESLQRLLDDPGFNGIPLANSGLSVRNSALLPQTQSRAGEDVTETKFVLELSINGLLAANIGSFLGLPDLFNTESGASGIGRFGLMDGASIFSYRGLFPPEPSAWEKIYLGWLEPFDIPVDGNNPIELPAVSFRHPSSIGKYPISSDEYFLVENRHRNPRAESLEITIRRPDGSYVTNLIEPTDKRFDPFNDSDYGEILEPGVVVNVSHFDWSLPGGPDFPDDKPEEGRILNGGILIWHIDNSVIRSTIRENKVNANSNRRGVQLVEADGARDIGRAPSNGQNRFVNGHAFDFWWSENDFTVITLSRDSISVYENRFGPDTQPSNHSNTGSPSFFEFYDFSDNLPVASFYAKTVDGATATPETVTQSQLANYRMSSNTLYPVTPLIFSTPDNASSGSASNNSNWLILPSMDGLYILPFGENTQSAAFLAHPSPSQPLIVNNSIISGQIQDTEQNVVSWSLQNGIWDEQWKLEDLPSGPGFISLDQRKLLHLDHTDMTVNVAESTPEVEYLSSAMQKSGSVDGLSASLSNGRLFLSDGSFDVGLDHLLSTSQRFYTGNVRFNSESAGSFFLLTDNQLHLIDQPFEDRDHELKLLFESTLLTWPAFADWNNNQHLDIFLTDKQGSKIHGLNRDGGILDHFPINAPSGSSFCAPPVFADVNGDGHMEMLVPVRDSLTVTIHGFDRNLRRAEGFPLLVGSIDSPAANPSCMPLTLSEKGYLATVSPAGDVRVWNLPELGDIAWGGLYGNQSGNKVGTALDLAAPDHTDFGLLNKNETYNWPNPARDITHVRFQTSEPARVDITVITQGGSTIFETQADSGGRHPQEVQINTSSWGNGVYFGRIRAQNGSRSESKLIKIVVTH